MFTFKREKRKKIRPYLPFSVQYFWLHVFSALFTIHIMSCSALITFDLLSFCHYLLYDVLCYSTFITFEILSFPHYLAFDVLSFRRLLLFKVKLLTRSTFCPSTFFTLSFFYFDVLSASLLYSIWSQYKSLLFAVLCCLGTKPFFLQLK